MKHGLAVAMGWAVVLGGMAIAPATAHAQTREVSRSSPIIATVGAAEAQFQGTFEVVSPVPPVPTFTVPADAATFEFPYTRGHLRAVDTATLTGTTTKFEDLVPIFDAAADGFIPPPTATGCAITFSTSCRTVFTTVAAPDAVAGLASRPARVFFDTANLAALKPLLAPTMADPDVEVLIGRVLAGVLSGGSYVPRLGGIDRSTMAIIDKSPFIPQIAGEDRPTMIYVGALDGMLHAIYAEVRGPCLSAGQELWAFIPRTQLGALRFNTQRIDGSIRVADAFDDFDLTGIRQYRTILTLQTGSGDPGAAGLEPSILAIDVSNPSDPIVLWERSTPASPATVDQGVGLGLAMGPARVAGKIRNLTFAQTNNGGSSTASGFYLAAIDTATGELVWAYRHTYPAPRNGANPPVPDTGIPGGPAIFDVAQDGLVSNVAVSSLYGDLWMFESDGDLPYTTPDRPIFRFSDDLQPIGAAPTIYLDQSTGRYHAVVVSGGYADPDAASWVTSGNHFAVAVVIDPVDANVPMSESLIADYGGDRAYVIDLGTGSRVTAQAVVAGNELFIVADKTDVNLVTYGETPDTGSVARYSLTTGAAKGSLITISGGASSVDVTTAGVVHAGDGAGAMKVDVGITGGGGAFDAAGQMIERPDDDNNARLLWLNG